MRRAGRCLAQVVLEATSVPSACSTSGRQAAEQVTLCARRLASGSSSAARYDFYDPGRNVHREFQEKWDRANAAAAEAAAADYAPVPRAPRHKLRGRAAAAALAEEEAAAAGAPARKDADWPPGYDALLGEFLRHELPTGQRLGEEEVRRLVEAARRGRLPASRELIRMRFNHLKDLEPRFPGFSAREVLLGEPRLLLRSVTKLLQAMLVFQDHCPAAPVGPLMARIGHAIVNDPAGAAASLRALTRALSAELGITLDPLSLSAESASSFMRCSPFELEARVEAVATIFGTEGGAALLKADMGVLGFEPEHLNSSVLVLREVFSAAGHNRVKQHHIGTPQGAAAAAADRAYVTSLALAWPGVLELPGRLGENGVAKLVAAIRAAGGARYKAGGGRRAVLLADVLERPEMLRVAAEAPHELQAVVQEAVAALPAREGEAGSAGELEDGDEAQEAEAGKGAR